MEFVPILAAAAIFFKNKAAWRFSALVILSICML